MNRQDSRRTPGSIFTPAKTYEEEDDDDELRSNGGPVWHICFLCSDSVHTCARAGAQVFTLRQWVGLVERWLLAEYWGNAMPSLRRARLLISTLVSQIPFLMGDSVVFQKFAKAVSMSKFPWEATENQIVSSFSSQSCCCPHIVSIARSGRGAMRCSYEAR